MHRTGLTPHVRRVWERRYGAVWPERTATNRRLYSNEDIKRLLLLRKLTMTGHSIRHVASLSMPELVGLVMSEQSAVETPLGDDAKSPSQDLTGPHIEACLTAIRQRDTEGLEAALTRAAVATASRR